MSTVCVVTGSRADYGLLRPVMRALHGDERFDLQVVITGMHLEPRFGDTWREIDAELLETSAKVPTGLVDDEPETIADAMARGLGGIAAALAELEPDLMLVLGDRFEIFAAVQAAMVHRIPVAHLCGGDVTVGAWDEGIRHAITKLSHLHFPSNADAGRRIEAMGEDPARVHVVGSTGIDTIQSLELLDRETLARELDFDLRTQNLLVTYHAETLAAGDTASDLDELLAGIDALGPEIGVIFTFPNADSGGDAMRSRVEAFTATRENAGSWVSLGGLRYLSAMKHCDVVVGNSSSGLYEAPTLGKPTVNVGGRQEGRPRAASVIDVAPERAAVEHAIRQALETDCTGTASPYGTGNSAARIVDVLASVTDFRSLLRKDFHSGGDA